MMIAFVTANMLRKKTLRIITTIYQKRKKLYVRKTAENKYAYPHIKNLIKAEEMLQKESPKIKFAKILKRTKKYVEYEYLPYPTLAQLIEKSLFEKKFGEATNLISISNNFMEKLETAKFNPYDNKKFNQLFDSQRLYDLNTSELCVKQGLLDIRFENLLIDQQDLYLIDCEWAYNYPIPIRYLKLRSLFYLSSSLQTIIKTFCSEEFPCYEVLTDFYIPKNWLDVMPFDQSEFKRFLFYENKFQNYISSPKIKFHPEVFLDQKKFVNSKILESESLFLVNTTNQALAKILVKKANIFSGWTMPFSR